MTPLLWREVPQKYGPYSVHPAVASAQTPKGVLGFIVGIMSGAAFSFLLTGFIVGYVLANILHR